MSDERHVQQHQPVSGASMPTLAAPSTQMLTVTKWVTFGIVAQWITLMIASIMVVYFGLEDTRMIAAEYPEFSLGVYIARQEFMLVLLGATLVVVVLIGIAAFLAGTGESWARIACTGLTIFPVAVTIESSIRSMAWWGLILLVPFLVLVVLWWLPGTSRGIRAVSGQGSVAWVRGADSQWPDRPRPPR